MVREKSGVADAGSVGMAADWRGAIGWRAGRG